MEITEKTKKQIGIGVSVAVVGVLTAVGYYYYCNRKTDEIESDEHQGVDRYDKIERLRMPKLPKSQWELDEMLRSGEEDIRKNYGSRWRNIDSKYEDLDNHDNRIRNRKRFTILHPPYGKSGDVKRRFKVLETVGDGEREKGRLRVSGNIYRKDTPSGYGNRDNRNPTIKDLIIS